mmetsp:Transcript_22668/g.69688  ORF Transcript_22668/g.69688 Transcript_22668/m.69688 type:complete len:393 (-) Transcript_22668:343-1521(-)
MALLRSVAVQRSLCCALQRTTTRHVLKKQQPAVTLWWRSSSSTTTTNKRWLSSALTTQQQDDSWLEEKVRSAARDENEASALAAALRAPELGLKAASDLQLLKETDLTSGGVTPVAARRFLGTVMTPPAAPAPLFDMPGTIAALEEKGVKHATDTSSAQLWSTSFMAGAQLGWGSCLMLVVAGGASTALAGNPGALALLKGIVFPVGLSYIVLSGSDLVTGSYLYQTMAGPIAGRVGAAASANVLLSHFGGNLVGSLAMVAAASATGIIGPLGCAVAAKTAAAKCGSAALPMFLKAVGANWLVATAIYQAGTAKTTPGKIAALWFPITTFIALGLEHSVANMFLLPFGMLNGAENVDLPAIARNIAIVSAGNALGAGLFVGTIQRFNIRGKL